MSLIKYRGYDPLKEFDVFNGFFDALNTYAAGNKTGGMRFSPRTDIKEKDREYVISMETPGLKKEKVKINVVDNVLTIEAEDEEEKAEEGAQYISKEIKKASFKKSFSLPEGVKGEKINARMENGILEVVIPKDEVEKKKKELEVKIK
jgi:HSP20 family protein